MRAARNGHQPAADSTAFAAPSSSPWDDLDDTIASNPRHGAVHKLASALRGRGGWRYDDALAYLRAVVYPRLDQTRGKPPHPYTLEELEHDVRDVFTRYPDGHGDDVRATPEQTSDDVLGRHNGSLIDWSTFWTRTRDYAEWLVEPVVPIRRSVSIYSPAGAGKSELALWLVTVAIRNGHTVTYLDLEQTEDDVHDRLTDMGLGPGDDLARLRYHLLPDLPPLDTEAGGTEVVALARAHGAELVVIDTTGRVLDGPENDADTLRAYYRHTGRPLKAAGIAAARLDHAGKDLGRGQRGTSAKSDDVDVVWELRRRDNGT